MMDAPDHRALSSFTSLPEVSEGPCNDKGGAIRRRYSRVLLRVELLGIIQRELPDLVLIRSPFQNVGLDLSVHVGIRPGSEARDGSGRAV